MCTVNKRDRRGAATGDAPHPDGLPLAAQPSAQRPQPMAGGEANRKLLLCNFSPHPTIRRPCRHYVYTNSYAHLRGIRNPDLAESAPFGPTEAETQSDRRVSLLRERDWLLRARARTLHPASKTSASSATPPGQQKSNKQCRRTLIRPKLSPSGGRDTSTNPNKIPQTLNGWPLQAREQTMPGGCCYIPPSEQRAMERPGDWTRPGGGADMNRLHYKGRG